MKITFLGTGANGGIPQLDCRCDNCKAAIKDSNLIRRRSSFLIETNGKKILLECGPDFWEQMKNINLKLQDLDLIVISHLHFDHANGLSELSGGKKWNVPVFTSKENGDKLMCGERSFLVDGGFMKLVDEKFAKKLGVFLVDIPHDPNFPTSGIVVQDKDKKVWFSTDVEDITENMKIVLQGSDLIIFDSTFFDESVFLAKKIHHMTIKRSLPELIKIGAKVVFSHINHSEDIPKIKKELFKHGFSLSSDGMVISV